MPVYRMEVRIPKLILGVAIIAAGLLFTLDNLGLADVDDYIDYWPVALIAVGLAQLIGATRQKLAYAALFIVGGVWILLYNLRFTDLEPWVFFWPIVLVLIGVNLILGAMRRRNDSETDDESIINGFALMSGLERRFTSPDFRGGDLTAIMGGCDIDLTQAGIQGEPPTLHVFAFWGGIDIKVPEGWTVDFRVIPFLGGASDESAASGTPTSQTLIIKGMAIMGGVEVKTGAGSRSTCC